MSITFKPEWARGLDGEQYVPTLVQHATERLENDGPAAASRGIEYALAAVCEDADTPLGAFDHLGFIIAELQKARENMRAEATEELEAATRDDKTLPLGFVDEPHACGVGND